SKVNLSVYFLPADGREKVIKIRRFSSVFSCLVHDANYLLPARAGTNREGVNTPPPEAHEKTHNYGVFYAAGL
ncbi:MAG: hypothetical protein LBR79_02615, partial [Oscillospiraceae bacterium]|nr:hypothetical protein [Oscillospiraceae bacterium]